MTLTPNRQSDYWPQDTDLAFYVFANYTETSLSEILTRAAAKWPGVKPEELVIEAEYVHLYCVGYDQYDSSDWATFLKISRETK